MRLMQVTCKYPFRDPRAKKQYVCVLIYLPANPLAWLAIQPALGSPPQARKSARIDPVFGTQCSQTSRTSGRAGDYESPDPQNDPHSPDLERARIN